MTVKHLKIEPNAIYTMEEASELTKLEYDQFIQLVKDKAFKTVQVKRVRRIIGSELIRGFELKTGVPPS